MVTLVVITTQQSIFILWIPFQNRHQKAYGRQKKGEKKDKIQENSDKTKQYKWKQKTNKQNFHLFKSNAHIQLTKKPKPNYNISLSTQPTNQRKKNNLVATFLPQLDIPLLGLSLQRHVCCRNHASRIFLSNEKLDLRLVL